MNTHKKLVDVDETIGQFQLAHRIFADKAEAKIDNNTGDTASQGYEITHAQSMNMNNSGRPRPPTASRPSNASSGRPRSTSRSSGGKRSAGGSGSKQTAKRRARERAMTQQQRAARKKQSILGWITTALVVA